jgi:CRISP-associated protein Cas1
MLLGRLGLETARQPHADRHGCIYLDRGRLEVEDGCLRFVTGGGGVLSAGDWQIPQQAISLVLLGPGSSVTHDALRILARQGTALAAVGSDGVRFYTAPPLMPDHSGYARRQAELWARPRSRIAVARRMYGFRLGEILPHRDIEGLRGIEGARVKEAYRLTAQKFGVEWRGRRYDRANPDATDLPNQAINHAASAVEGAAAIAVAATATIPQLGFIHEDSGQSFVLDVADLVREEATLPIAFGATRQAQQTGENIERLVRRRAGRLFNEKSLVPLLIDRIKAVFDMDDASKGHGARSADVGDRPAASTASKFAKPPAALDRKDGEGDEAEP